MEQLGSHWTDFNDIRLVCIFRNYVETVQDSLQSDKNNGYFTWRPMYNFYHIFLFLLTMRNFLSKFVEKIKTHILWSLSSCFRKSCCSWDKVEKYYRDGQATNDSMALAHFTLGTWGYKHNSEHVIVLASCTFVQQFCKNAPEYDVIRTYPVFCMFSSG